MVGKHLLKLRFSRGNFSDGLVTIFYLALDVLHADSVLLNAIRLRNGRNDVYLDIILSSVDSFFYFCICFLAMFLIIKNYINELSGRPAIFFDTSFERPPKRAMMRFFRDSYSASSFV